jgi:hypothetical protein
MGWIRRLFGLCDHDWKYVEPVMSASGYDRYYEQEISAIQLGEVAQCRICGERVKRFFS